MATFYIKKGDRLPSLAATLKDSDGLAINLTGATVQFRMKKRGASAAKFTSSAAVVSPSAGTVRYDWGSTDTNEAGVFDGEFVCTFAGSLQTVPSNGYVTVEVQETTA